MIRFASRSPAQTLQTIDLHPIQLDDITRACTSIGELLTYGEKSNLVSKQRRVIRNANPQLLHLLRGPG